MSKNNEYNGNHIEDKYKKELDNLVIKKIDTKRIKNIDQSKKIAAFESVFDERTFNLLNKLVYNGILSDFYGIISAGKEANVYLAYDHNNKEVAIKIYKIDSNTSKWMKNYIIGDPRFKKLPRNVSKVIYLWASKEYKNLKRAYKVGLAVPKPIYVKNNILVMDYIGNEATPAPKLKDVKNQVNLERIFEETLYFIKNLYQKAKLVHADLSEFNILYHNRKSYIIDISQAVDTQHAKAEIFLVRDIKNIFNFFKKSGVNTPDPEKFYYEVINLE